MKPRKPISPKVRTALEDRLAALGPRSALLEKILVEVADHFVRQQMIVSTQAWAEKGSDVRFIDRFLREAFAGAPPDEVLGLPVQRLFKDANLSAHCTDRTPGAASYYDLVVDLQGGEYCCLCGARSNLEVDHIVPVRRGGSRDSVRNMQLLCEACNTAKAHLQENLLPAAITTSVSSSIQPAVRLKFLLVHAIQVNDRTIGRCVCGSTAADTQLNVSIATNAAAGNFSQLKLTCSKCEV